MSKLIIAAMLAAGVAFGQPMGWFAMQQAATSEKQTEWESAGLDKNLVAYFSMDEFTENNIYDSVKNAKMEIYGNPTITTNETRVCVFLDGNDYIYSTNSFDFNPNGDVTFSAWVYKIADSSGDYSFIFDSGTNQFNNIFFSIKDSDEKLYLGRTYIAEDISADKPVPRFINNWHNIVFTKTDSGQKLFIDGNLVTSSSLSLSYATNTTIVIGGEATPIASYLNGFLDEVALWKCELTTNQIYKIYSERLERR